MTIEYLPNRLTLVYSKNYYKEENYLKVRTKVFKYITPLYSNDWVCWNIGILVHYNILTDPYTYILIYWVLVMWLAYYSLLYSSTGSIMAYTTLTNSLSAALSSYNTWFIRSITPAPSLIFSSLKTSCISKSLIRGVVLPFLI